MEREKMKKSSLLVFALVVLSIFIAGCPKKTPPPPPPPPPKLPEPVIEEPIVEPEPTPQIELRTVYFDYDRYSIREDQAARLRDNADQLMKFPDVRIVIEGNCDERGTGEYNIALGEKRARAVKDYLTEYGIGATRITTRSYGEEKPVCTESNEDCWQRNRRCDFVTVSE